MVHTKTWGKLILEQKKKNSSRFSTLISPCELHKEQDDIGFITVEHWWRAGWAKVLTRGNERAISHWLRAHHRLSRMLRWRWPLSCDCLDEGTYGRAKYGGVKHTHTSGPQHSRKGKTLMHSVRHTQYKHSYTYTYTLCIQRPFVCIDSLMVMAMMMTLMLGEPRLHSGDLCQVSAFLFPLESIWCTSPHSLCLILMSCLWQ